MCSSVPMSIDFCWIPYLNWAWARSTFQPLLSIDWFYKVVQEPEFLQLWLSSSAFAVSKITGIWKKKGFFFFFPNSSFFTDFAEFQSHPFPAIMTIRNESGRNFFKQQKPLFAFRSQVFENKDFNSLTINSCTLILVFYNKIWKVFPYPREPGNLGYFNSSHFPHPIHFIWWKHILSDGQRIESSSKVDSNFSRC